MTIVHGLDRLPGTAIEGMDDDMWARHTQEVRERFSGSQEGLGFAEFAAQFASGEELQTEAMKQHANMCGRRMVGGPAGLGPAWTRGEIERPAGTKSMGSWTAAVYTPEQQLRLGVDEQGQQRSAATASSAPKTRWPEHIGQTGEFVVAAIWRETPHLAQVVVVPEDAMVTMDHQEDRVRVFVDAAGNVTREPSCG